MVLLGAGQASIIAVSQLSMTAETEAPSHLSHPCAPPAPALRSLCVLPTGHTHTYLASPQINSAKKADLREA